MLPASRDVPLRIAPFSLPDRCLIWTTARMYADRLELSGWGLRGRYWRHIPFEEITEVDHERNDLVLYLRESRLLRFRLDTARRWCVALNAHLAVYKA